MAAFSCLARDSGGGIQFYRSGRIVASSALVTEAWAVRIACGMVVDMGISTAVFESDCHVLVDCMNNKNELEPWEIAAVVADMKQWACQKNWKFTWACREQNKAAHWFVANYLEKSSVCFPGCIPLG